MLEAISNLVNIDDFSIYEVLQEYNNKRLSLEGLIFILKNKYSIEKKEIQQIEFLAESVQKNESLLVNHEPLISVIVPTFNRKMMLKECIDSVLSQTYNNYEILIMDDNSSDGTERMIKKEFKKNENIIYKKITSSKDAGYNRYLGYNLSKGEYIIFLDDDDFYLDKYFFKKAIEKHIEYKNLSFVSGNSLLYTTEKKDVQIDKMNLEGLVQSSEYLEGFGTKYEKPKSTFSTVFKKEMLEKVQFSNMLMMNDISIYLRALLEGQVYILNDIVGAYRVHNTNISKNVPIDFILKNQEEKIWVYNNISNLKDPNEWLFNQLMITFRYYIYESNPYYNEIRIILSWCFYKTGKIKLKLCLYILGNWIRNSLSKMRNKTPKKFSI